MKITRYCILIAAMLLCSCANPNTGVDTSYATSAPGLSETSPAMAADEDEPFIQTGKKSPAEKAAFLAELELISESDSANNAPVTVMEALYVINRIVWEDPSEDDDPFYWYENPEFEPLNDVLSEQDKCVLMELQMDWVIQNEEILSTDFNAPLSRYQAMVYITRLIGNTYGCTDVPAELSFKTREETQAVAYQKKLIQDTPAAVTDDPITHQEFYCLVYNALYAENIRGGDGGAQSMRYIDWIMDDIAYEQSLS